MQIDYKKAYALLWSKHEYQHSGEIFVKNIFKPFHDTGLFTDLFFDTSSDFFFLFEACIIYCFICFLLLSICFWFCFGCIDFSLCAKSLFDKES